MEPKAVKNIVLFKNMLNGVSSSLPTTTLDDGEESSRFTRNTTDSTSISSNNEQALDSDGSSDSTEEEVEAEVIQDKKKERRNVDDNVLRNVEEEEESLSSSSDDMDCAENDDNRSVSQLRSSLTGKNKINQSKTSVLPLRRCVVRISNKIDAVNKTEKKSKNDDLVDEEIERSKSLRSPSPTSLPMRYSLRTTSSSSRSGSNVSIRANHNKSTNNAKIHKLTSKQATKKSRMKLTNQSNTVITRSKMSQIKNASTFSQDVRFYLLLHCFNKIL